MDHLAEIDALPPDEALHYARCLIEDLTWTPRRGLEPWPGVRVMPKSAALLWLLARHEGQPVPAERCEIAIWGYAPPAPKLVNTHASLLRRRIVQYATLRGHMGTLTLRLRDGVPPPWSDHEE